MHLTEDFPISSRLIRKTFRDEQKMNPNSARNIWKLFSPEPDPIPTVPRSLCAAYQAFSFKLRQCVVTSQSFDMSQSTSRPKTLSTPRKRLGSGNMRLQSPAILPSNKPRLCSI